MSLIQYNYYNKKLQLYVKLNYYRRQFLFIVLYNMNDIIVL